VRGPERRKLVERDPRRAAVSLQPSRLERGDAADRTRVAAVGKRQHELAHHGFTFAGRDEVEAGAQRRLGFSGRVHAAGHVQHAWIVEARLHGPKLLRERSEVRRIEGPADEHPRPARQRLPYCGDDGLHAVAELDRDAGRAWIGLERPGQDVEGELARAAVGPDDGHRHHAGGP
jgi:hypothetical protein